MIPYPVILLRACVIVIILAPIFFAVIVALAIAELVRSWRDARAVIKQTQAELAEIDAHAAAGPWSDEENEILLGLRPFQ